MFRRNKQVAAANQNVLDILFKDVEKNKQGIVKAGAKLAVDLFGRENCTAAAKAGAEQYFDHIEIPTWLKFVPFSKKIIAWAKSEAGNAARHWTEDQIEWLDKP